MKSRPIGSGQAILASQNNDKRDDARGGSFLLAHQQLGVLALPSNPSNGQVIPIVINGTTITITAKTGSVSSPNDVLAPGTPAGFASNVLNFLRRSDLTTTNQVAASSANQTLLSYVGWAYPGSSTNIVPFSLNKNVNGIAGGLTSFNITGITVTSGTWTAQTMQLYVEDGTYFLAGTRYLFNGGSAPTVTAPVSHPRIDILSLDTSGTLSWTTGTESVTPSAPAYPANKIPICELYNVVGETALYDYENQQGGQGYIYNDVRPTITNPWGLFILDPGSEAQGDVLYYNGSAWARLPAGTNGYVLQTKGASANPQWALLAITAQIKDASGPNITPNADNAFHTIATYSSIPAITANQTIWMRGRITNGDTHTASSRQFRVQMNGTTIFTGTGGNSGGADSNHFDVMIIVPTPASSQTFSGIVSGASDTYGFQSGAVAANLSSTFSITVQYLQNTSGSPAMNGAVTLTFLEMSIFN